MVTREQEQEILIHMARRALVKLQHSGLLRGGPGCSNRKLNAIRAAQNALAALTSVADPAPFSVDSAETLTGIIPEMVDALIQAEYALEMDDAHLTKPQTVYDALVEVTRVLSKIPHTVYKEAVERS